MSNGCPVCGGLGRILAFGACRDPIPVTCPECAGLEITPASAEDARVRVYRVSEVTALLLDRWPALPAPGETSAADLVQPVDELPQTSV